MQDTCPELSQNSPQIKMLDTCPELSQNSPQIKPDAKFFTRLVSKESSMSKPSFRVYYGAAPTAVPFMWESQPGTPKHPLSTISLPPLTPPPSYYSCQNTKRLSRKHSTSSSFLDTLLLKINVKKAKLQSFPSSLSSSSWSSSSTANLHKRSKGSSTNTSFDEKTDYSEYDQVSIGTSPTSILCFGGGRKAYSIMVIKNTLLAMVGRRSG